MMARCERKVGQAMGSASVVFDKARKLGWGNLCCRGPFLIPVLPVC